MLRLLSEAIAVRRSLETWAITVMVAVALALLLLSADEAFSLLLRR